MINGQPCVLSCCKEEQSTSRSLDNRVGNIVVLAAYLNIFLNPLIYILRYDVVKRSLINWREKIAAKFKNKQPPATSWNLVTDTVGEVKFGLKFGLRPKFSLRL